jgi:hypothetical protein
MYMDASMSMNALGKTQAEPLMTIHLAAGMRAAIFVQPMRIASTLTVRTAANAKMDGMQR